MKNRKIYYLSALCLGLSLLLSACGSGAKSIRLRKAEGTVQINNDKDKELKTKENLKLYSGYSVCTKSESYAWVDLDSAKLTKLDQGSRVGIVKDGKNLTIDLKEGCIFFNITEPLADDESMDIRTSTLAVGIRGTCGWVGTSRDDGTAWVYLLEGKVECTMGDESVLVKAGEMAALTKDGKLVVDEFDASAIPGFVQDEADENEALDEMIQEIPAQNGTGTSSKSGTGSQAGTDILTESGTPAPEPFFTPWAQAGLADHVMDWQDEALAQAMAEITGIPAGEIKLSDVWEMTELTMEKKGIRSISALGELTNLTRLNVWENEISDIGALGRLTNLTFLNISGSPLNDISTLGELTNLTVLYLFAVDISDISPLGRLANLEQLGLTRNNFGDISVLEKLPNLTNLWLRGEKISDISVLGKLKKLEGLELSWTSVSDFGVLGELTNLTYLHLFANKINDLRMLSGLTNLKTLYFYGNKVSNVDISVLGKLTNLNMLLLSGNGLNDISALGTLTNLTQLDLNDNNISDVSALKGLSKLDTLNLSKNPVTDYSPVAFVPNLTK